MSDNPSNAGWPALPYEEWKDTCATLHLWTQIVGKIRLAHTPWLNHSWHVPLYVTARGLGTSPIPYGTRSFEITFDFTGHKLDIDVTDRDSRHIALQSQCVADFQTAVVSTLADLGIEAAIDDYPCEIPGAIAFSRDHDHCSYDADYAHRFWRVLLQIDRVFKQFRTGFLGKSSPVHFFWGSFDLAVTRFSGRRAPPFDRKVPGVAVEVMQDAYSHEVSSAGFWPGDKTTPYPCFYSYAYPTPDEFKDSVVHPREAFFHPTLGEFLLPYDVVRRSEDPDATLLSFLQSTYEAEARSAHWDRAALECPQGMPRVPNVKALGN